MCTFCNLFQMSTGAYILDLLIPVMWILKIRRSAQANLPKKLQCLHEILWPLHIAQQHPLRCTSTSSHAYCQTRRVDKSHSTTVWNSYQLLSKFWTCSKLMRVLESQRECRRSNKSESLNSHQLSHSFDPTLKNRYKKVSTHADYLLTFFTDIEKMTLNTLKTTYSQSETCQIKVYFHKRAAWEDAYQTKSCIKVQFKFSHTVWIQLQ